MADLKAVREEIEAALDATPDDWGRRLVLADALDELGDEVGAFCQRWMAGNVRRPLHANAVGCWLWYRGNHPYRPGPEDLPISVYDNLRGRVYSYKEYLSRRAAETALAGALQEG